MQRDARLSMFDRVRVRATPATEARGLAGRIGTIYGETTPSVTGVTGVVGESARDYAVSVHFDDGDVWLYPELLDFVDHAPGTTMKIGAGSWTREAAGTWKATSAPADAAQRAAAAAFERAFGTLLYGLRNADLWDLAARLKAMLGDGAFTPDNVTTLANGFGTWSAEARTHASALPSDVVAAMNDVAVYLSRT